MDHSSRFLLLLLHYLSMTVGLTEAECNISTLAVYNITFTASWSINAFPKQYPRNRPYAQWTQTIGRSHDETYELYKHGELASQALKTFVEKGTIDGYESEQQGRSGILDMFTCPAIDYGSGSTTSKVLLDGKRSLLSMVTKIVPSPDWFVGIDSIDLCENGSWKDEFLTELQPMDAGTDQGYTFTAPNWPEDPQKGISIVTSQYPDHPASSFFYPDLEQLPPIGQIVIRKMYEYSLTESFVEFDLTQESNETSNYTSYNATSSMEEDLQPVNTEQDIEALNEEKELKVYQEDIREDDQKLKLKKGKNGRRRKGNRKKPKHCRVSEWSEWTPCSKTCGYGVRSRVRKITREPNDFGRLCPELTEETHCGSMRTCNWNHFGALEDLMNNATSALEAITNSSNETEVDRSSEANSETMTELYGETAEINNNNVTEGNNHTTKT